MDKALSGIRVLEPSHAWAGPLVGMFLADMGAEVIHVEKPEEGDMQRSVDIHGPGLDGENLCFLFMNRNKKGITLDLKKEKGKEIFKELVKKSDIVIENFTPGTMEALELGYDTLNHVNPKVIMVSVSGFGQYGPYREHHGYDLIGQAMSGWMSITGFSENPPVRGGAAIADYLGGLFGVCGALTALHWKEKTGKGQRVDVSLMDSAAFTLGDRIVRYAALGLPELIARTGNRYPFLPRSLCYPTKDGYFTIRVPTEAGAVRLAQIIGRDDLSKGDGNKTKVDFGGAWKLFEALEEPVKEFLADKTNDEAMQLLENAGIACSPILSLDEVIQDPHFNAREMMVKAEHPKLGELDMVGVVPKLSETPGEVKTAGPLLGQHNEEVYYDLLGYSADDVARLKQEGIV